MRTTLTLDPDVAAALERLRRAGPRSFKALVNELLRRGLEGLARERRPRGTPYRTRGADLGRCRLGSLDNVADALAVGEGESFR